jgi:hypothetical protein
MVPIQLSRYWVTNHQYFYDVVIKVSERRYGVSCVVLVINDNPYGLMVADDPQV